MAHGSILQMGTVAEVSESGNGDPCRYTVQLARPVAGLAETVSHIAGVSGVQVDRDRLVLEYSTSKERAAALLVELVRRDIPVASFGPNAAGLEEAYLRTGIRQVD
jgi:hypothetical protein